MEQLRPGMERVFDAAEPRPGVNTLESNMNLMRECTARLLMHTADDTLSEATFGNRFYETLLNYARGQSPGHRKHFRHFHFPRRENV